MFAKLYFNLIGHAIRQSPRQRDTNENTNLLLTTISPEASRVKRSNRSPLGGGRVLRPAPRKSPLDEDGSAKTTPYKFAVDKRWLGKDEAPTEQ